MSSLSAPWVMAALGFLIYGFARGIHSTFSVFYVVLLEIFGWGRGATAGVFSLLLFVEAVSSPWVGFLMDRYGPKKVVGLGCLVLAVGLLLSGRITTLWEFYLYFGLISAVGLSLMGMVPHVVLVSEWFSTKRGSALGLIYAGAGAGILFLAPLTERLISQMGWAGAFQILAAITLFLPLPLVLAYYRRGPYEAKLREPAKGENQWTASLALRSLQFWLIFVARVIAAGGTIVIVTHQVAHVADIGFSRFYSATIFGLMGVMSAFGRPVFGLISDLVSKQAAYTLNIVMTVVGVGALMATRDPSQSWLLYTYVFFFGIGFGSRAVILSLISADIFGGRSFGAIYGYSVISVGVGGALGSWLGGLLYDLTGSYIASFALSVIGLVLSDLCVWLAPSRWVVSYDIRLWRK